MRHIQFCTESGKFELCFRHAIMLSFVQGFNIVAIVVDRAPTCICCAAEDGHGICGYNMNSEPIQAILRAVNIEYPDDTPFPLGRPDGW